MEDFGHFVDDEVQWPYIKTINIINVFENMKTYSFNYDNNTI